MHDPLEDKELAQCLYYYIQEVAIYNRKEKDASIVKWLCIYNYNVQYKNE